MERHNLVIAIDGPAGSGKSTVSKLVAKRLGLLYLDTGAMYRALTLKAMNENIDMSDDGALTKMAESTTVRLEVDPDLDETKVFLDNEDVSGKIRTPELTDNIKFVAKVPGVRACMVKMQRGLAEKNGAVLEGRDTTTVVFSDANFKFYLDADIEERAKRRFKDMRKLGVDTSIEEVREDARRRDESDQQRKVGALKQAKDAIYVDTSNMSIEEVVDKIVNTIEG